MSREQVSTDFWKLESRWGISRDENQKASSNHRGGQQGSGVGGAGEILPRVLEGQELEAVATVEGGREGRFENGDDKS